MDDRQYWHQRLDEYIVHLSDRKHSDEGAKQRQRVVRAWIDFAGAHHLDPAAFDEAAVKDYLEQQDGLAVSTRRDYASHLRVWCRWASTEPSTVRHVSTAQHDGLALWTKRLEEYLSYLQHRGRQSSTIRDRRRKLSNWIRFACSTGRNPAVWDPAAIDEAFVMWGTVDSATQRDRIRGRIQAWCQYWRDNGLGSLTLADLVQQFRDRGYPDEDVPHHRAARAEFERVLNSLPSLSYDERDQLKAVWNSTKYDYGGAGVVAGMHSALRDVSEADWPAMRDQIYALCHGPSELAARFDGTIASVRGLGELMATRMLAITWPNRFLPNFMLRSANPRWPGKLDMIELLGRLDLLDASSMDEAQLLLAESWGSHSVGDLVVRSNDLLRELLHPFFSDDDFVDSWGMAQFLYWLAKRDADSSGSGNDRDGEDDRLKNSLAEAATELLCEMDFLEDVVERLKDKGQVILYGPPGTGKTYFARKLARALTSDSDASMLVQFHPAYSYEDFFEGIRPRVLDGQMTYELTPGPLVRFADRARERRDETHVMVIDEINRANLPRVLGELLYLLEYREDEIHTQYRPNKKFSLPENLLFIGTMNTADRSIALIDAAMRRRFHCMPFFPDREPTAGLLRRWCEANEPEQIWVADLLNRVNERLRGDLGGDYMLIGPSHFMKSGLGKRELERIWKYNIEPLIEDQFFGRQEVIASFQFDKIWDQHGPSAASPDAVGESPDELSEEVGQILDDGDGNVSQDAG
ncbi:AAA family ATPase [Candidatus Poriferisodalis sp.]|uniref:AAA family ATPase n=1 Tax=Candidatus Poriferisodalis sp. TaxID=3101277 RepID=UPI003B022915